MKHVSADQSHYDEQAEFYDLVNEERAEEMNRAVEEVLRGEGAQQVLDMTCGTGLQVFWLKERGFEVVGVDINEKMLARARKKGDVKLLYGDVRSTHVDEFDAVITMWNAIGHLSRSDFEQAMRNVAGNLRVGGVYVFDIFNVEYLEDGENITELTIDWLERSGDAVVRKIQYSTIDREGVLASYTINHVERGGEPEICTSVQTLQVYGVEELREMLERSGFERVDVKSIDGSEFRGNETERMLVVARKR